MDTGLRSGESDPVVANDITPMGDAFGRGDPSTRSWWKDKEAQCGQTLSPYECGHAPAPSALLGPHDPPARHATDIPWWELPRCQEPVAEGHNPLGLCANHLALYDETIRTLGLPVTKPGRHPSIIWDFASDHPSSLFTQGERAALARNREVEESDRERRETEARAHFARLSEEAEIALAAARVAKAKLEAAEAAANSEEGSDAAPAAPAAPGSLAPTPLSSSTTQATQATEATEATKAKAPPREKKPRKPRKPKEDSKEASKTARRPRADETMEPPSRDEEAREAAQEPQELQEETRKEVIF